MVKKYKIILLQNNLSKKILFKSNVKRTTYQKFNKLLNATKPSFYRKYVKRKYCQFELAIFSKEDMGIRVYRKDDLGRNVEVSIDIPGYHLMELTPFWVEELIYDHQNKTRITFNDFMCGFLPIKGFKQVFTLNNKLIVQEDSIFNIFSLKNVSDCNRLLDEIKKILVGNGRVDCLLVRDYSTVQRKQLYKILEEYGFDRKFLYKQYTY